MDANMCRVPEDTETLTEFLASLSDGMLYPHQTDRAGIRSKQRKGQPDSKKNMHLRTAGILHQIKQYALRNPDKFTIHTFLQSSEKNKDTLSQSIP